MAKVRFQSYKSRAILKIAPIDEDDGFWETVIDFTKIKKGGVPLRGALARLQVRQKSK